MPFQSNPLYNDRAAQGAQTAEALAKLGSSLFGGGDPLEMAKATALGASTAKDRSAAALSDDKLQSLQGLGDIFKSANASPEAYRAAVPELLAAQIRAGVTNPGANLNAQSAFLGDDSLARAGMIGAGHTPGADFALDTTRADGISARDASESLRQANSVAGINNAGAMAREMARPRTLEQRLGDVFNTLPQDQQTMAAIGKTIGGVTPRNVILPNGETTVAIGNSYRDADGALHELPMGSRIFTANATGADAGDLFGKAATNDIERAMVGDDLGVQKLDTILSQFKSEYMTAPRQIENTLMSGAERLGMTLDPEGQQRISDFTSFRANVMNQFNSALKVQSGTALSPGEVGRMETELPVINDAPSAFLAKANTVRNRIVAAQRRRADLRARGVSQITDDIAAQFPLEGYMEGTDAPLASAPSSVTPDDDGWSIREIR